MENTTTKTVRLEIGFTPEYDETGAAYVQIELCADLRQTIADAQQALKKYPQFFSITITIDNINGHQLLDDEEEPIDPEILIPFGVEQFIIYPEGRVYWCAQSKFDAHYQYEAGPLYIINDTIAETYYDYRKLLESINQ